MTREQIERRIRALQDYRMSLLRLGEDSDAADREFLRIQTEQSKLREMLKWAE